ncbi:MAG TPA: preprotein translocase subunit YajC [Caulobacteraceae bacterium]|nr:preprotein translocase subunit YajC [Caulobacteraceae bacterium]
MLGGPGGLLQLLGFPILLIAIFYVMIIAPQQRRQREHTQRINAIKRGDTVVLSSGLIGKVVRVEDKEVGVEVAQNVTVKVVKSMITEVRARGEPAAANETKP